MQTFRRGRVRAGVFLAIAGVVAILSALGVGLLGSLSAAATTGVRTELASRGGGDLTVDFELDRDVDDPAAQDAAVREVLAEVFRAGAEPVPIVVDRTVVGATRAQIGIVDGGEPASDSRVQLASIDGLLERAALVDGAWPSADDEVSVQADAAAALGLRVGTVLRLDDSEPFTVTALWRLEEAVAPRWTGDGQLAQGSTAEGLGPLVLDEAAWDGLEVESRVRWTVSPQIDQMEVRHLGAVVTAWRDLPSVLRQDGRFETGNLDRTGRLASTATELDARAAALSGVQPLALLVLGAIAAVTLLELGRLLAVLRAAETLLLWSRGATVARIAWASALEAAAVALVGAAVGAGAAIAMLALVQPTAVAAVGAGVWAAPIACALLAVAAVAGTALSAARAATRRETSGGFARSRRWAGAGAVALLAAAAGLAVWQLRLYGAPTVAGDDDSAAPDPLVVLAPALALLALVLVIALVLPVAATPLDRRAGGSTTLPRALLTRTLVRRPALSGISIALTALACGQLVFAAAYAASWDDAFTVTREARAGAAVRVTGAFGSLPADLRTDAAVAEALGDARIAAVAEADAVVAEEQVSLVAVTPAALRDVADDASGLIDLPDAAAAVDADIPEVALPADAAELELDVEVDGLVRTGDGPGAEVVPTVLVRLVDGLGASRELQLTRRDEGRFGAEVPPAAAGAGSWRLGHVSLRVDPEVDVPESPEAAPAVRVTAARTAPGAELTLPTAWVATAIGGLDARELQEPSGAGATLPPGVSAVRLLPALTPTGDVLAARVAVSRALAERLGLAVGDRVPLPLDPRLEDVAGEVTAVLPVVPGAERDLALLIDLDVLRAVQLRVERVTPTPSAWWVSGAPDVAGRLEAASPIGTTVLRLDDDPTRTMLGSAATALWISAAGAALLALMAVVAVAGAQVRSRSDEAALLLALGVSARHVAALRRTELLVAVVIGALTGLVAGAAVAVLTVPALARSAVPDALGAGSAAVTVAFAPLLFGLALLLGALCAVAIVTGRRAVSAGRRRGWAEGAE